MSFLEQVREASMYKFMAQGEAYFPRMHTTVESIEQMQTHGEKLVEGTFVMVIDEARPGVFIPGFRLVEAIVFEGDYLYLTAIKDHRSFIDIHPVGKAAPVESISLSLICNDVPMYMDFLDKAIHHYGVALDSFDWEICLAFFSDGPPMFYPSPHPRIRAQHFPRDKFHMAYARNRAMEMCSGSHILMVSLDCLLSGEQLLELVQSIPQTNGVINFCKPTRPWPGNALILGEREKMTAQGHHEGFQGFFFEDTEYLMNFSRTGTVPHCHFVDFDYTDHPRGATRGWFPKNQAMFESILKGGRP